jgi:hypothetical protein
MPIKQSQLTVNKNTFLNEMTLSRSKLCVVFFLFLTGTPVSAEVPVSYSGHDHSAQAKAASRADHASKPGMHWQILPGEDIPQIARLMFPDNARMRDAFMRAVIRKNPELFPDGVYQPIPTGTTVYIPDLRTIGAYAKPARKAHPSNAARASRGQMQAAAQAAAEPGFSHDHPVWQLIMQLEKIAEEETSELNKLLNRIESIEKQIIAMQSLLTTSVAPTKAPLPEATTNTQAEANVPQPQNIAPPAETAVTPPQPGTPQPLNPAPPVVADTPSAESALFPDNVLLLGILLILLIVIVIVRSYRKIKERLSQSREESLLPNAAERQQYEALLLRRNENKTEVTETAENPSEPPSQILAEARALIEQDNAAIQLLQKHLAQNQQDIPAWLLLFELLYKATNKRDFKKNARRFKRLGEFPDIWQQIQKLGNQLEPNESLYFDEQKRKEKFFSEAGDSDK